MVIAEGGQAIALLLEVVVGPLSSNLEHFLDLFAFAVEVQEGVAQIKEDGFYRISVCHLA